MGSETQSPSETTVIVMPAGASGNSARENAAHDVLLRFGKLPPGRLLCFFDDEDCLVLKSESVGFGKANRGVSSPVTAPSDFYGWPMEAIRCIYPSMSLDDNRSAFDFVTYLHNSSCLDPLGMTMTFAHELRHFTEFRRGAKRCATLYDLVGSVKRHFEFASRGGSFFAFLNRKLFSSAPRLAS
jgi:hypothetical protein